MCLSPADELRAASRYPLAYFLTWTCYGTWLPGDDRGWIDAGHNLPGTPRLQPDATIRAHTGARLLSAPVTLDGEQRQVVANTIRTVCGYRQWQLHALNVRTNHVHVVASAAEQPDRLLSALKAWSTRRLRELGMAPGGSPVWTKHGSTRYLWLQRDVDAASTYVLDGQGAPLTREVKD
ncbi:MAG: transposase [Tepidiformaceae bacterium]